MPDTETPSDKPPIHPLMAAVVTQMFKDSEFTTNALLDSYEHQAQMAEVTLELVRGRIGDLLSGDYMPTSHALVAALWPSDALIEAVIEDTPTQ